MSEIQMNVFKLDASETITLTELAECCGLSVDELDELMGYNALAPLDIAATERVFSAQWVMPLRTAVKLRVDFDLDLFTVGLMLGHLDRIGQLERQVQSLQAMVSSNAARHLS
jgi:chaperone modulatory protein CbpM